MKFAVRQFLTIVMLVPLLVSCGGGGTTSAQSPPAADSPVLVTQTIAFADSGPINKVYGDANFTNLAAGGSGSPDCSGAERQ